MGHFLRGDKWATFETGKSLGHIAFPDLKQCFFGGQSEHVDENLHTAPMLPVREHCAESPAQIYSLGMLRKGLFLHPSKVIRLGYRKLLHRKELQYLGCVDLGGECSHPA